MQETSETEQPQQEDWLAGAMIEFGGECEESIEVPIEGIEFGDENVA